MFLIYSPETSWTQAEWVECVQKSSQVCDELAAQGKFLDASPLHPVATASTVRVRHGESQVTAGPFAETVEQLGGYYILELEDLDEAIGIATRLPPVHKGTVEIRPVLAIDGLPNSKLGSESPQGLKRYLLICYDDESLWQQVDEVTQQCTLRDAIALANRIDQQGRFLSAAPLHATTIATCVRVRGGQRLISDGPFAETNEVLGGYYMILANDSEEALAIASQHPGVTFGAVEVRQVFDMAEM
ncbi:MAG TPA: YciI family protein [Pirellulaceae bacterium]|nr:YciI family protein [Pirellulaceae bacterium]HMO91828.1 YciI family protein [Pirellulaceae bacterium]